MDGYSGIHFSQQGHFGNVNISGNASAANNTSQSADITNLQPGDTFRGEIASVNGEDVQIQLANGQLMAARLERDVQVALGQLLNLQVQSNKDNKIVLKPVYDNNMQLMRVGEAALRAANISVNDRNLNLVANLLQNGMSIDKNTLMAYNRLSIQNPQADVSEIIKLNKLEIPVNEENINQLQSYENLNYKLVDGVNQTANEVLELYEKIAQSENLETEGQPLETSDNLAIADKFMEKVVGLLAEDDESTPSIVSGNKENNVNISGEANFGNVDKNSTVTDNANTIKNENVPHETILKEDAINETKENNSTDNIPKGESKSNLPEISKSLSNENTSEIPAKIVKYISDGKLDIKDVKQLLSDSNIGEKLTIEQKAEVFKSEPFKALVKDSFQNRWTITPNEVSTEGKVQEFYEKLARETSKLSKMINDAINESGQDPNTIQAKSASNMSENIEFMNQVNHMMNYVQLPLKLSDSQAHGDLYVYANKKHLARKDGMLTAFLHLDMDNLGSVDVSIALQTDKNEVTTKFYLDEDVIALVEAHKEELENRLAMKGYQCKTVLLEKDEDKSVIEHLEEQVSGQNSLIGYQSFDIRA
jgi:hypothetical protein